LVAAESTTPDSLKAQLAASHDSGSVKVIALPSRRTLSANWSLAPNGTPRGGGLNDNPEDELDHTNGYLRGFVVGSGSLVALDRARLRFYAADGTLAATFGRPGAGPGEARLFTSGCATRGDTVVAFDHGTRRMTVATREGGIVRQVDVSRLGLLMRRGCFGDGTLAFERRSTTDPNQYQLLRVDLTGRVLGVVASYAARQNAWRVQVAASGQSVAIADPLAQRIDVLDTDGRLRASVRLSEPVAALTPAELRRLDYSPSAQPDLPADHRRPLYGPVVLDRDGVLWLRDFVAGISDDVGWTGVSIASGAIYRFQLTGHPLNQSWPPAELLDLDLRGALFRFEEREVGAAVFAHFALRPVR
jgi:hypothetical protein